MEKIDYSHVLMIKAHQLNLLIRALEKVNCDSSMDSVDKYDLLKELRELREND
jgi:hypothetical protein